MKSKLNPGSQHECIFLNLNQQGFSQDPSFGHPFLILDTDAPVIVMPRGERRMDNPGDSDDTPFYSPRNSDMVLLSN